MKIESRIWPNSTFRGAIERLKTTTAQSVLTTPSGTITRILIPNVNSISQRCLLFTKTPTKNISISKIRRKSTNKKKKFRELLANGAYYGQCYLIFFMSSCSAFMRTSFLLYSHTHTHTHRHSMHTYAVNRIPSGSLQ